MQVLTPHTAELGTRRAQGFIAMLLKSFLHSPLTVYLEPKLRMIYEHNIVKSPGGGKIHHFLTEAQKQRDTLD